MRNERSVYVSRHAVGVVRQRHRSAANDEQVGHDASADQTIAQR